jgi:hypothetical protein
MKNASAGTYLNIIDSQELFSSLEQTLMIEFEILDDKAQVKDRGLVGGEPVGSMEGYYSLWLLVEPEPFEAEIAVKPRQKTSIVLVKKIKVVYEEIKFCADRSYKHA